MTSSFFTPTSPVTKPTTTPTTTLTPTAPVAPTAPGDPLSFEGGFNFSGPFEDYSNMGPFQGGALDVIKSNSPGISYDPATRRWTLGLVNPPSKPEEFPSSLQAYKMLNPEYKRIYDLNFPRMSSVLTVKEWESQPTMRGLVSELNKQYVEDEKKYNELMKEWETSVLEANKKNEAYNKVLTVARNTRGGDYTQQRDLIRNIEGIDDNLKSTLENYYKAYYSTEKIQPWDSKLGAKPQYGDFDGSYYKSQNPSAAQQWEAAVANDNIDITQRYGTENSFYLQHYTNVGKAAGLRGNKAEELSASKQYVEKPTDKDFQDARSLQLNINTDTQAKRLLSVPEIADEWEKAKANDVYWQGLSKKYLLDTSKPEEFIALFRMSDRPEDKNISFQYNINANYGITELEDALNQAVGEKAVVDVKKLGALAQDVLKQTIDEMKKAKIKEQNLAMFSNFDSLKEIININQDLSNSILGDSGIGGMLSFTNGKKTEESLQKALRGITGINNEVTYNWQQWFDDTLKTRYQNDLEIGLTKEEAEEKIKIEGEFARNFIDQYLIPRFNESRSMNEFVDYIGVTQSEQNPFQTQDMVNAVKLIADLRANQYIDQLKQTPEQYFDSTFYFSPTGDKAREQQYSEQASTVAADWEAAKKGDQYWAEQAYRFGINVNDKDAFARMHFQIKGQGKGYDAANDILNASKVSDEIYNKILPALKQEALEQGTIFGQFIKPEEFADEMLKGLNPNDKTTWEKVLEKLKLKDFSGDITELKNQIAETVRTGSAQDIREQIKYLNEKKEKPTQQNLGITYIQREEDYKTSNTGEETALYKTFQSAGFKGTEDEFYESFFPDLNRSEQVALTKAGAGKSFAADKLDFSDPFASFGTVESFFGEDDQEKETPTKSSYFTIDEDEDLTTKSKSGQGFLDEFTSLFKGLS